MRKHRKASGMNRKNKKIEKKFETENRKENEWIWKHSKDSAGIWEKNNLNRPQKFERIVRIPDGVFERILKKSKECETIRNHPNAPERKNLKKKKESENIWKNPRKSVGI